MAVTLVTNSLNLEWFLQSLDHKIRSGKQFNFFLATAQNNSTLVFLQAPGWSLGHILLVLDTFKECMKDPRSLSLVVTRDEPILSLHQRKVQVTRMARGLPALCFTCSLFLWVGMSLIFKHFYKTNESFTIPINSSLTLMGHGVGIWCLFSSRLEIIYFGGGEMYA